MYEKEIEQLQEMIDESSRIVFFGGAGVSCAFNLGHCLNPVIF